MLKLKNVQIIFIKFMITSNKSKNSLMILNQLTPIIYISTIVSDYFFHFITIFVALKISQLVIFIYFNKTSKIKSSILRIVSVTALVDFMIILVIASVDLRIASVTASVDFMIASVTDLMGLRIVLIY